MAAQSHTNAGVYDLGRYAVALLVRNAEFRIPTTAVKLLKFRAHRLHLLSFDAGRRDQ